MKFLFIITGILTAILIGILASFSSALADPSAKHPDDQHGNKIISLDQLAWKNRLILAKVNNFQKHESIFKQYEDAVQERNIAWFILHDNNLHSNLRLNASTVLISQISRILQDDQSETFLLIGYDGEIKARYNGLEISRIFELIDSMPMRQYEMANP